MNLLNPAPEDIPISEDQMVDIYTDAVNLMSFADWLPTFIDNDYDSNTIDYFVERILTSAYSISEQIENLTVDCPLCEGWKPVLSNEVAQEDCPLCCGTGFVNRAKARAYHEDGTCGYNAAGDHIVIELHPLGTALPLKTTRITYTSPSNKKGRQ